MLTVQAIYINLSIFLKKMTHKHVKSNLIYTQQYIYIRFFIICESFVVSNSMFWSF